VSLTFWANYLLALLVVGLMLLGLAVVARNFARGRVLSSSGNRLVTVVESTMLSQHASVHVVKAGGRYLLIGGSNNGPTTTLAELSAAEVEAWIELQRQTASTVSWRTMLQSLRGRP